MYVRIVFFMCDGRQLQDVMNVGLSSLIMSGIVITRWKGVSFNQYFYLKNRGVNFCLSMSAWGHVAA